ncbi:hypothetical protein GOP47_0003508 [Adiantum capillus-veneris]|uniref:DUF7734 domain-containing protein n=1 Tax=Adiantum capillus-veneris TaxID=13818 RepID=A0A9D4VCZ0_ADICA|nr:hypothetical protein GOP47_0003508 [Adiantum capillus-veneris]
MEGLLKLKCHLQPSIPGQPLAVASHTHANFAKKATALFSFRINNLKRTTGTCCFSSTSESGSPPFNIAVLEDYTRTVPSELLLVHAMVDDEEDEVLVYRGHSSSLMRTTSSNLEDELLPPDAIINGIDRMEGPYNPDTPKFIEKGLSWDEFVNLQRSKAL